MGLEDRPIEESELNEQTPKFETIRKIALAELGPILNLSYQEALAKTQEIAGKENITNPLLVIAVESPGMGEFIIRATEEQWQDLFDTYEDEEELTIPVAFVVDGDKYNF